MERGKKEKARGNKEKAKGNKENAKGNKENAKTNKENAKVNEENAKGNKEKAKGRNKERNEFSESTIWDSDFARSIFCHICLRRDHPSFMCPYRLRYPAGAVVGRYAEICCLCCGEVMPHPGRPSIDWDARCDLRPSDCYPTLRGRAHGTQIKGSRNALDAYIH